MGGEVPEPQTSGERRGQVDQCFIAAAARLYGCTSGQESQSSSSSSLLLSRPQTSLLLA